MGRTGQAGRLATLLASAAFLAGCAGGPSGPDGPGGLHAFADPELAAAGDVAVTRAADPALDSLMEDGSRSEIIEGLLNRVSVLEPGPLRDVADAVMAANARAAEADLRAATLRAEAQSTNWLPRIGPQVSLDALGAVVASMVITQAIFDNGGRRAERDFAAADVEVAAVALAEDSNQRVREALELYLTAEAARARAAVNAAGMAQMERFAYVMSERVNAGISDRADLSVVQQKLDQMRSDLASDNEAAASAMAELQAMADGPVDGVRGLSGIGMPAPTAEALDVLRARAEGARSVAYAQAQRAGLLPGLSIGGDIRDGVDGLTATIAAPAGLGLGTGAAVQALNAEAAAVEARIGQEREAADRAVAALEGRLASLQRQAAEADALAADAAANFALFAEQQRHGQRSVPETVGVFETKIRAERAASDLRFDIALTQLRIAARLGALVDGDRI